MTTPTHHLPAIRAGAQCEQCPLLGCGAGPVPPSVPATGPAGFLVVSEFPGPAEVEQGATAVGPAGREIRSALSDAGVNPEGVSYTNAMLCRPPGGDIDKYLRECKKAKKPSPVDCCAPRLRGETDRASFVLYLGTQAVKSAGVGKSVMPIRGTPIAGPPRGLATLHPSFVVRDAGRVLRGVFRHDVAKAVRLASGGDTWTAPPYKVNPPLHEFVSILDSVPDGTAVAVDTETDGIDPWMCKIRRIGLGTAQGVLIYAPLSMDGTWLLPSRDDPQYRMPLSQFFARPMRWFFHNFYGYDSIVLAQHGMPVNETHVFDSLIGHHVGASSELPHTLAFLGSIYTDAPYWKDTVKHEKEDT